MLRLGWKELALACMSAALLIPAMPRHDVGALAWVGLAPLLVALDGKRPASAFVLSYLSGLIFFHGVFSWIFVIGDFNVLDQILLAGYLSAYYGVFGMALAWIRRRTTLPMVVVAPPLWVALEYLRAHASFLSLPWMLLGYSQHLHTSMIQVTALTGVYGLAFLIVLTNALLADLVRHWTRARMASDGVVMVPRSLMIAAAVVALLLLGTYGYGRLVLSQPVSHERMRIGVVQGNVPQQQGVSRHTLLERYAGLTRQAAAAAPALIVWPETAVPGDIKRDRELQRAVSGLATETARFLLVGASQYAKLSNERDPNQSLRDKWYNSMLLLSPDGRLVGEYRKIALIPFGEYEPLSGMVTWPKAITTGFGKLVPGEEHTLFSVDGRPFGAVICWEIIFPDLFRQFVKAGASFMVNATNESWFGATAVPHQLLAMAAIRSAENRVSIARAANTALSAFVDPYGRVVERLRGAGGEEMFVEGVLVHDIIVSRAGTFYTRHGDVFAFAQIGLLAILFVWSYMRCPRFRTGT